MLTAPTMVGLMASPKRWEKRICTASAVDLRAGTMEYWKRKEGHRNHTSDAIYGCFISYSTLDEMKRYHGQQS